MSTRANIVVKDNSGDALIFYRHSDGYPRSVMPVLGEFMDWLKAGKIRDNVQQAAGWLILLGADEARKLEEQSSGDYTYTGTVQRMRGTNNRGMSDWKASFIEPTACIHGDIEYLYEIDLSKKTLKAFEHNGVNKGAEIKNLKAA